MNEPKGILGMLVASFRMSRQRKAFEQIKDGDDDPLLEITKAILMIDGADELSRICDCSVVNQKERWLEKNLRPLLLTPDSTLGHRRRKLLKQAGFKIYLCNEDDYDTATIGLRGENATVFAKAE